MEDKLPKIKSDEKTANLAKSLTLEWSLISVPKNLNEAATLWREDRKVSDLIKSDQEREAFTNILANDIMRFVSLISAPTNITKDNVYLVSETFLAINDVKHLSLRELKGFLKSAFELKFGKLYGGFGLDTLITWFNDYYSERSKTFDEIHYNEHMRTIGAEKVVRDKPSTFSSGTSSLGEILNG